MAKSAYRTGGYQRERKALIGQPCAVPGCGRPSSEADHQPPLSLHVHQPGTGCCILVPSCFEHARRQGGLLASLRLLPERPRVELVEPEGFDRYHEVWDVSWLKSLRGRIPKDAAWPRLMTVPHPRAVDSLGAEMAAWAKKRRGPAWYWWQRLFATRLLEVDVHGELVWETALLTVARQVGKTWLLHDLCAWRLEQGDRFGCPQAVLSLAMKLDVVKRMQTPSTIRAGGMPDLYGVRKVNGQEGITWKADGSEWMIRSVLTGGYSLTTSFVTVDEAWKVKASVVDDALIPTMVSQPQTQLLLCSTAHRAASSLMIGRRASALDRLGEPEDEGGLLLVEWSSPRAAELADVGAWRQASPHWDGKRERTIRQRLDAALAGESDDPDEPDPLESVRAQWFNQWPPRRVAVERGELLVDADVWDAALFDTDSAGPLTIGVEDYFGHGAAIAFCGQLPDGRHVLNGFLCPEGREEAWDVARLAALDRPGSTLVIGLSLTGDPALESIMVAKTVKMGRSDTGAALTLLRDRLGTGRVVHDGSAELSRQVLACRILPGSGVPQIVAGRRDDLLRAAVWTLRAAVNQPVPIPAIH